MKAMHAISLALAGLLPIGAHATPISGIGAPDTNAALLGGVVVDFETTAPGDYSALGVGNVTFKGVDDTLRVASDYAGSFNTTGRLYLENGPYDSTMAYSIRFEFTAPVDAFGFNWGAADDVWLLSAYDSSNNLLDSLLLTATGPSNSGEYFGIAASGIAYATLIDQSGDAGDYVMIDRFTYGAQGGNELPEPASMALVGLGLVGLAALRKRKTA